ncbi:OLC1v1007847C1 [Oldenlandia corymbosa var. corymbosa]|uniref:OLC1v1007847C1 n=1 Tax=Oldenlandia corymbosa var. corymbosa TaxID=529605 RepID=A0AAV1DKL7_OLDCO|nr:OLC1v1007847C1 [Oldenlandia corymbosa var. corymbosa]
MAGAGAVNPMTFDRVKAKTHGAKPRDAGALQRTKERVIVPFKSDARQLTLGPNFPSALENLKEYIPMLNPELPYYKYENPYKFENWAWLRVWPWSDKREIQKAFVQRYHELEPEYPDTWKMGGIYDLLKFSTIGLGESRDLVEAVLGFWSGSNNVLCFPWGLMTPTLLDVCIITGLPAVAYVVVDGHVIDDDAAAVVAGQPRSYGPFINEKKRHTSRLYHIQFLAMWLNMYVFPGKSFQMTMDWYHVAGRLASGVQMNLAEAILAMLYHCFHEATHNPSVTLCSPVWVLHFWLYIYFPSLKPEDWWYELSIGMYRSGFEAIKTFFGIGKFAKNKSVGGVAETEKKGKRKSDAAAKTGGLSSKKSTATADVRAKTSTGKDAPTSTRRSKRLIGRKRSATEVSNKENLVSVFESEEEEAESPGSEKGSVAVAEDRAAQKTAPEIGGARSKKEKNKLLSEQLIEQAGKLETNIKEAVVAELKEKAELEKVQAKRKQLEAELSGVVADTDVALDGYGRMTTVVNQLLPKFQDAGKVVEGG